MSKRTLTLSVAIAVIVVAGIVWLAVSRNQGQQPLLGPTGTTQKIKVAQEKEETYTDTAGFSFKHPESITVADKTPEDEAYYTLLSLKSNKGAGEVKITIKDTTAKDVASWLSEDETAPQGVTLSGATSLGGISASQYSGNENLYTIAVDKGILYLIEGIRDGGYWDKVQDLAASSFTTAKPQAAQSIGGSDSGAEDVIYEEEEVIE